MMATNLKLTHGQRSAGRVGPSARHLLLVSKPASEAHGGCKTYTGEVLHGKKLGRTLGFPTANLAVQGERPRVGIYAARARLQDGRQRLAVAYYGDRPTVQGLGDLLEVFLFDFNEEIYGQTLEVELVDFIRGDVKFIDLETMKSQIAADCINARSILSCGSI